MKINERFKLRQVGEEWIMLLQGQVGGEMSRVIAFNKTSVMLWNAFKDKEFTEEQVCQRLLSEFDITPEVAARDAHLWVETLKRYGVVR